MINLSRILRIIFIQIFIITSLPPIHIASANSLLGLPEPGEMVQLSPVFEPVLLKGIKVHPENPFKFDFILDLGKSGLTPHDKSVQTQSEQIVKYFMTAMTVPDKDIWVNLSPYEKDRLIESSLGKTVMGRDMLAQDYLLKQLTASLIYPEKGLGKKFWERVYAQSREKFGKTDIPVNTFNKVWIVADNADVFEHGQTAYVLNAHLKVMLEEDYLAKVKHQNPAKTASLASNVIRQVIIPEIEHEVNYGEHFAPLRQIYYAMILASWYKTALKNALLNQIYSNRAKVDVGVKQSDVNTNDMIFQRYLSAYKKGVFNYIKEDIDSTTNTTIPRKYFSGGVAINAAAATHIQHEIAPNTFDDAAMLIEISGEMTLPTDSYGQTSQIVKGVDLRFNFNANEYKVLLAVSEIKIIDRKILKAILFRVHPGQEDQLVTAIDLTGDEKQFEAIVEGTKTSQALFKRAIERLLLRSDGNLQMLPEEIYNLLGSHADLPEYKGSHTPIVIETAVTPAPVARPAEPSPPPPPAPVIPAAPVEVKQPPLMLNKNEEIIAYYNQENVLLLNDRLAEKLTNEKYHTEMIYVATLSPSFELPDGSKISSVNKQLGQTYFPLHMPGRLHVLTKEVASQDGKITHFIFRGYQKGKIVSISVFNWDETKPVKIFYNKELSELTSTREIAGYATLDEVTQKFQAQIKRPDHETIYTFYDRDSKQGLRGPVARAPRFGLDYTFPDGQTTDQKIKSGALNEPATRFHMPFQTYNLITEEKTNDETTGVKIIFRGYKDGVLAQVSVFDWDQEKSIPVYNAPLSDQYTASETTPAAAGQPAPEPAGEAATVPATPRKTTPIVLIASVIRTIANDTENRTVLSTGNLHRKYELPDLENLGDMLNQNNLTSMPLHLGKQFARLDEIRLSTRVGNVKYIVFIAYDAEGNIQKVSVFDWDGRKKIPLNYNQQTSDAINASSLTAGNMVETIVQHLAQAPAAADQTQEAAGSTFEFEGQVLANAHQNRGALPRSTIFRGSGIYFASLGLKMTSYLNMIGKFTFPLYLGTNLDLITYQEINDKIIFYGYKDGELISTSVFNIRVSKGRKFLMLNIDESFNLSGAPAVVDVPEVAPVPEPAPAAPAVASAVRLPALNVREIPTPFEGIPQWRNVVLVLGETAYADIEADLKAENPGFFHFIPKTSLAEAQAFLNNHGHNVAFAVGDKEHAIELFDQLTDHPFPVIIKENIRKESLEAQLISGLVTSKRAGVREGALRVYLEENDDIFTKRLKTYLSSWAFPKTENVAAYGETPLTTGPEQTPPATPSEEAAGGFSVSDITPQATAGKEVILIYGENVDVAPDIKRALESNGFRFYKITSIDQLKRFHYLIGQAAWIITTEKFGGVDLLHYLRSLELKTPVPLIAQENAHPTFENNTESILARLSVAAGTTTDEGREFIYPLVGPNQLLHQQLPVILANIIQRHYRPLAENPVEFSPAEQGDRDTVLIVGSRQFYYESQNLIKGYNLIHVTDVDSITRIAREIGHKISFVLASPEHLSDYTVYYQLKSDSHPKVLAPIFIANSSKGTNKVALILGQNRINGEDADAITLLKGNNKEDLTNMERIISHWPYAPDYRFPAEPPPSGLGNGTEGPPAETLVLPSHIQDRNQIVIVGEAGTLDRRDKRYFEGLGYEVKEFPYWNAARDFVYQELSQIAVVLTDTQEGRNAFYRFKKLIGQKVKDTEISPQFPFIMRSGVTPYDHLKKQEDKTEITNQERALDAAGIKVTLYSSDRMTEKDGSLIFRDQINHVLKTYFDVSDAALLADNGGIDFRNFRINRIMVGTGVTFSIDHAMVERFKNDDFRGFDFRVDTISPLTDLSGFLGLQNQNKSVPLLS